jgi:crotonobetainyl-CoA:carnitine CoA-transferase CaiB-like acyl-CoA transferase
MCLKPCKEISTGFVTHVTPYSAIPDAVRPTPNGARRASAVLPLEGVTVVALEHAVAAPFASRQLADLGARVIKIERPGVGDFARGYDKTVHGMSSFFVWANRGKESLSLDLKHPDAADILQQLLGEADVLIQNPRPAPPTGSG